jgi:hypothetical protein
MKRRFKQLLNLYLDGQLDLQELIELKHLLALSTENQKEFQGQCRLQAAMKQMQQAWVLPEATVKRTPTWRISLGMAAMAALAVFGFLLWLQTLDVGLSVEGSHLSSIKASHSESAAANVPTQNNLILVDFDLDAIQTFGGNHLGARQLLELESNVNRQEFFEAAKWSLQPDYLSLKSSERVLPRAWQEPSKIRAESLPYPVTVPVQSFVQPANFRFP